MNKKIPEIPLLNELRAIEQLEEEIKQSKLILYHQLEYMQPKKVGSVNYANERVQGGINKSEESSIMEIAKQQDKIEKLELLISIMKDKCDNELKSFYNMLTDCEAKIFDMRYIRGNSINEIADNIGLGERQTLRRLKDVKRKISVCELNKKKVIDNVLNENVV